MRRLVAIGTCGLVMGGVMSVFAAPQATGRIMARCDQRIGQLESEAAREHHEGKRTTAQYEAALERIAAKQQEWGC